MMGRMHQMEDKVLVHWRMLSKSRITGLAWLVSRPRPGVIRKNSITHGLATAVMHVTAR